MNVWIIQLVVSPAFERMQSGFVVHAEIGEDASNVTSARFWKSEFDGLIWAQDLTSHDFRQGPPTELEPGDAEAILSSVRSAKMCVAAPGDFGYIHPTRFQLTILSGFNSCSISWVHELPAEWSGLYQAVKALSALGNAPVAL